MNTVTATTLFTLLVDNEEALRASPSTFLPFGWEDLDPQLWDLFDQEIEKIVDQFYSSSSL